MARVAPSANSSLIWNAENRLVAVTTPDNVTSYYTYDYQGRRIGKQTATAPATLYDGWNPIAEYTGGALNKSYTWGMDLSGSMQAGDLQGAQAFQRAGGVGGLLLTTDYALLSTGEAHYPTYDANGNVSEYLDASGTIAAHYQYDAFGNTIVKTGTQADAFSHRFSTKTLDSETGLYYYGYRYYDPTTGRWPSRDPIEEDGGMNLYGFVSNNAINDIDINGLKPCKDYPKSRNDGASPTGKEGRTPNQIIGPIEVDGCTNSPDTGPGGADFARACYRHDTCYGTCGSSRESCDINLESDLVMQCTIANGGSGITQFLCELAAGTYFRVVRAVGPSFYEDAQDDYCEWECCTP